MRDYVAVVAHENNRVAKMMDFDSLAEAQAHAATHGGFAASAPAAPIKDWYVDGSTLSVSALPGTSAQVVKERERRLALGFDYDFQDERGVHHIGTTKADMDGWNEVKDLANALIDSGQKDAQINIWTDTGPTVVTALEWQAIILAANQVRQILWAKSFDLQAMQQIPGDYDADTYWT